MLRTVVCLLCSAFAAAADPYPLPMTGDGRVTRMLHLGATAAEHVYGSPASAPNILFDLFLVSGAGPEHRQQPQAGDGQYVINHNRTWTALDDADGIWSDDGADGFFDYYAFYVIAPDARAARLWCRADGAVRIWIDGADVAAIAADAAGTQISSAFALAAGRHVVVVKLHDLGGSGGLEIALQHADGRPMTDLAGSDLDLIPPRVLATEPAMGATGCSLNTDASLEFNEPMNATWFNVQGGVWTYGYYAWITAPDPLRAAVRFNQRLATDTTYTVTPVSFTDRHGNPLVAPPTLVFTTTTPTSVPAPTAITPAVVPAQTGGVRLAITGSGFLADGVYHPIGARERAGHRYSFSTNGTNWDAAHQAAQYYGGHLATLGDAGEDAYVWRIGGRTNAWIGLHDPAPRDGLFAWVDGGPTTYANWSAGEPNDFLGAGEDKGIYWHGLRWNDVDSSPASARPYVIEYDRVRGPEASLVGPTTIALSDVVWHDDGAIEAVLPYGLPRGDYDLVVVNRDGATGTLVHAFTVANRPPVVNAEVFYESPAGQWNGWVWAYDPDGDPITLAVASAPAYGSLVLQGNGYFTCAASGSPRNDAFVVVANDGTDDSLPATMTLVHQNQAPQIVVTSPDGVFATHVTNDRSIICTGTASDDSAVAMVRWSWWGGVTHAATGTTDWSFTADAPAPGWNSLLIEVIDDVGASAHVYVSILLDPDAPMVFISEPVPGDPADDDPKYLVDTGVSVACNGYSYDANDQVAEVRWSLSGATDANGVASGTYPWSFVTPPLAAGLTTVSVTARDRAGNVASANVTLRARGAPDESPASGPGNGGGDGGGGCGSGSGFAIAAAALALVLAARRARD